MIAMIGMSHTEILFLAAVAIIGFSISKRGWRSLAGNRRQAVSPLKPSIEIPPPEKIHHTSSVLEIASIWLAPSAVLAVFMMLSGLLHSDGFSLHGTKSRASFVQPPVAPESEHRPNPSVIGTEINLLPNSATERPIDRPSWTKNGDETKDDVRRIVLTSKLWSTDDEARSELFDRALSLVQADFVARHRGLLNQGKYDFLKPKEFERIAVKEQFVERMEQDFGTFTSPMLRVWWQLEISPLVRTELYPAWKAAVIGNRVLAVGAALALLTMLANFAGLWARLSTQRNSSRFVASLAASTSTLAWIACEFIVVKRLWS